MQHILGHFKIWSWGFKSVIEYVYRVLDLEKEIFKNLVHELILELLYEYMLIQKFLVYCIYNAEERT